MEIFNIGIPELILILVLMLVILGPDEMIRLSKKIGEWIVTLIKSPLWKNLSSTVRDVNELPRQLAREANLEETVRQIKETNAQLNEELRRKNQELSNDIRRSILPPVESQPYQATTPPPPEATAPVAQSPGDDETFVHAAEDPEETI